MRETAQERLLQMLDEAASKAILLEREKAQAVVRMQVLESELGELARLVVAAGQRADEILMVEPNGRVSHSNPVVVAVESNEVESVTEPSVSQPRQRKFDLSRAFSLD